VRRESITNQERQQETEMKKKSKLPASSAGTPDSEHLNALKSFLMGPGEKFRISGIDLLGARFLAFYKAPDWKLLQERLKVSDYDLECVAMKYANQYNCDSAQVMKKIDQIHSEALTVQLEQARYLPDLIREAFQRALTDVGILIRAPIFQSLGINLIHQNPWTHHPLNTELKKGILLKTLELPKHRPKGSKSFDKIGFLIALDDAIRRVAKRQRHSPSQSEVARQISGFACANGKELGTKFRRCVPGKRWDVYVRMVLAEAEFQKIAEKK
jgi:hypothetical protein